MSVFDALLADHDTSAHGDGVLMAPDDIAFENPLFDVAFHPTRQVIAVADIDGYVFCYQYKFNEDNFLICSMKTHSRATRALRYSPDGKYLFSASSDKSIAMTDTTTYLIARKLPHAHEDAIYSMAVREDNLVATGDDDGVVKLWDLRQKKVAHQFQEQEGTVVQILFPSSDSNTMIAIGDCGYVAALDVRGRLIARSDQLEQTPMCGTLLKRDRLCAVGTEDGTLELFEVGDWATPVSSTLKASAGKDCGIQAALTLSDDAIVTGAADGLVRGLTIEPTSDATVLLEHMGEAVERLAVSADNVLLASIGLDKKLKFVPIAHLFAGNAHVQIVRKTPATREESRKTFYAGFDDDEEEEDDDDDDDDDDDEEEEEEEDDDNDDDDDDDNDDNDDDSDM